MQLTSLPESFVKIVIGSKLGLSKEELENLPENFGDLDLRNNQLRTLPESFGHLQIEGNLILSSNKLEKLPKSFLNLK